MELWWVDDTMAVDVVVVCHVLIAEVLVALVRECVVLWVRCLRLQVVTVYAYYWKSFDGSEAEGLGYGILESTGLQHREPDSDGSAIPSGLYTARTSKPQYQIQAKPAV